MIPQQQKILTKLAKQQEEKFEKVELSIMQEAKSLINEVGKEIDFVDKLQNEILSDIRKIRDMSENAKGKINGLDNAKAYKTDVKNLMKRLSKAAKDLGVGDSIKNSSEYRLLDSSLDLIDDLEADNKEIKKTLKSL